MHRVCQSQVDPERRIREHALPASTILVVVPTLISTPTVVEAAGNKPKRIREYVGRVNSDTSAISIAVMQSPVGWIEPGQTPEFREYTLVLRGLVRVTHSGGVLDVGAGQTVVVEAGEWVQYSTPEMNGAEYVSVCVPAFSPDLVHRDA
jgi:quercetin dioxygenase-like cupin family protein